MKYMDIGYILLKMSTAQRRRGEEGREMCGENRAENAVEICRNAAQAFAGLSREIDHIKATGRELEQLERFKKRCTEFVESGG